MKERQLKKLIKLAANVRNAADKLLSELYYRVNCDDTKAKKAKKVSKKRAKRKSRK